MKLKILLGSVLKATRRPKASWYAWTPRRQGMIVAQGELGPPGRLGDAFETLLLGFNIRVDYLCFIMNHDPLFLLSSLHSLYLDSYTFLLYVADRVRTSKYF
jgi:hypothetical protein